jgi:phosphoglycerol transferase
MVKELSFAGFNGIYLDTYGYSDNGKDIIAKLENILGTPIISDNTRLYFFSMTEYNRNLKNNYTDTDWKINQDFILHPLETSWEKGFGKYEGTPECNWHWCSEYGEVIIDNPSNISRTVTMELLFVSGYDEMSNITINGTLFSDGVQCNVNGKYYTRELIIPPGKSILEFHSDARRLDAPNDPRVLVFRVVNFRIT